MESRIKYLLKFGERKYIEDLPKGILYFSNAKTFRGIEKDMKIKGQGDIQEGAFLFNTYMLTINGKLVYNSTVTKDVLKMIGIIEAANNIPVYCLYAVLEDDCNVEDDGKVKINLSEKTIRSHFPNADAVAVINNPECFMKELEDSIDGEVKSGLVHYFYTDGELKADNGFPATDLNYAKFITNDQLIQVAPSEGAEVELILDFDFVDSSKLLFAKDDYYKDEQEFRIILTNKSIDGGKGFPFETSLQIPVIDLDKFFKEMCVKSYE